MSRICNKSKLEINWEKTCILPLYKNAKEAAKEIHLAEDFKEISFDDKFKRLGVWINKEGDQRTQVAHRIKLAKAIWFRLKKKLFCNNTPDVKMRIDIWKALVRSVVSTSG